MNNKKVTTATVIKTGDKITFAPNESYVLKQKFFPTINKQPITISDDENENHANQPSENDKIATNNNFPMNEYIDNDDKISTITISSTNSVSHTQALISPKNNESKYINISDGENAHSTPPSAYETLHKQSITNVLHYIDYEDTYENQNIATIHEKKLTTKNTHKILQ